MTWLHQLLTVETVAQSVLVIAAVAVLGLAFGSLKFKGIGLGVAGVLFSGLAVGHLGITISPPVMEFAREFGLILFVYTIGMQVGPGFFASLRRQGLPLNLMAAAIVVTGSLITIAISRLAGVPMAAAVGLFAGATTNTPSLGAAQEAIRSLPDAAPGAATLPGLGYAVAYPFGVVGIILAMLLLKSLFRVDLKKETADLLNASGSRPAKLSRLNLLVTNANLEGMRLDKLPLLDSLEVVISRIQHQGEVSLARPELVIHLGDTLLAVGPADKLDELRVIVGEVSSVDLRKLKSNLVLRQVVVTKKAILGRALDDLGFLESAEITVTRVSRAEVELSAIPGRRLQFGDVLTLVGSEEDIAAAARELGNSLKQLNHTELIPVFVGIGLGVLLGSVPLAFPGMPAPAVTRRLSASRISLAA
jgi:putative transport protein